MLQVVFELGGLELNEIRNGPGDEDKITGLGGGRHVRHRRRTFDPETGKPTKVKYEVRDGVKVRVAKSGKVIGETAKTETKKATKKSDDKSE